MVGGHKEAMEIKEYLPNNSKTGDFNLRRTLSTLILNHRELGVTLCSSLCLNCEHSVKQTNKQTELYRVHH